MEAGAVSRQLCSLWIKIGILTKNDKNMSCNILRKSASTNIREAGDPRTKEASDLMAHSTKTAEAHYVIRKKQLSAASGSTALRSLSNFTKETEKQPKTSKRKLWNSEETLNLKKVCADEINNGVTLESIRLNKELHKIDATERQVYDKVRSLSQSPVSKLQSNTRTKLFNMPDRNVVRNKCKDLIQSGSISYERIENALEDTNLLEKYSLSQVKSRITYERRQKRQLQKKKKPAIE